MKKVINILKVIPGAFLYSIAFVISWYYGRRLWMGVNAVLILWSFETYYRDKTTKEYTDWLEQDREKWYKKYVEEKYGKKETDIKANKNEICKN